MTPIHCQFHCCCYDNDKDYKDHDRYLASVMLERQSSNEASIYLLECDVVWPDRV
jgi:hypothetical protein